MHIQFLVLTLLVVIPFFHLALCAYVPLSARMRKVIKVEYFENCDQKVYPIMCKFSFVRNGTDVICNGETTVSREIKNPIKLQFRIEKCRDKSNPDTCEYYTTWKFDDLCMSHSHFNIPFVRAFMDAFKPPFSCPVKKNNHYARNVRIPVDFIETFLAYGDSNVLWKFRMRMLEDSSMTVGCQDFAFRFAKIRVRV